MRHTIAVLAILATGLLPACGAPEREMSGQLRVAQAATSTQDAGSAKMAMEMKMSGGAQDMTMTAEGAFEFASQRGSMVMDMGSLGGPIGMGKLEMIMDGTIVYMSVPEGMGAPTPWIKMDLEAMGKTADLSQLSGLGNSDPTATMQMLRGVSDDVEEVGTEEIRGVSTTHYRANVDMDKAIAEAPKKARRAMKQQFESLGTSSFPVDVWIDDDDLLRRQTFTMDLSKAASGGAPAGSVPTSMTVSMDLYDFGTEVNVEPPPAKDVTDMSQLPGGGG